MRALEGIVLDTTTRRLIAYGLSEREAILLARFTSLELDTPDGVVLDVVIRVMVSAKMATSGSCEVEVISAQRRDNVRDNTQLRLEE